MKVVVHDASILIDLALSKTVEAWFAGGIETWTTELIFPAEIGRPEQRALFDAYAVAGKLKIRKITPTELETLVAAQVGLGTGLSLADVSALTLARQLGEGSVLATGDRMLRKTADKEKINACGILGLFDVMVSCAEGRPAVLPFSVAIEKLRDLMQRPECRLPAERCAEKIKLWSQNRTK
jgi:predicted nucleic acid-binding protein